MPNLNDQALFMLPESGRWNLYASSTFTAENPALAVQNKRPGIFARSTDTTVGTPAFIRLDPTVDGSVDPDLIGTFIGYAGHNGTIGTLEYRVRIATVADFSGGVVYDSGSGGVAVDTPFADREFAHIFDNPADHDTGGPYVAGRYLEISLWATSATYIDIGEVFLGTPYQPERNIQPGGMVDPSAAERVGIVSGSRGQEFDKAGTVYDVASGLFLFSNLSDLKNGWADLATRAGGSGSVLYIKDPTEVPLRQQQYVYGRFTTLGRQTQLFDGLHSVPFQVTEYH